MLGIVTITNGTDNFGNLLQNYAVQQILLDLGYESETIRNISFKEYRRFGFYFLPKFATGFYKGVKSMKFMRFARKHIKYSKAIVTSKNKNLNALRDQYDKVICGSDQVWNPDYRGNQNWDFNLMQFARPEQKVAYAASFGLSKIPEQYDPLFKDSLQDYHSISVREIDAAMFYTRRFDQIGLFLPKTLYGRNYKKMPFLPFTNPEHPEITTNLPPCILVTSHADNLRQYTIDFYEALCRNSAICELLDFAPDKRLTHAFSVFYPALGESQEAINAIAQFFHLH